MVQQTSTSLRKRDCGAEAGGVYLFIFGFLLDRIYFVESK